MKEIFAEIGFGNDSFLSTEIEEGKREYRVKGFFIPNKVEGFYFRFWIFKRVFVLSTLNGFEIRGKGRNKFKILFGIRGVGR
tara:strand:+ start:97 stop:342 length:246 start_codon:yes stop_codon:yes gene_type:complete